MGVFDALKPWRCQGLMSVGTFRLGFAKAEGVQFAELSFFLLDILCMAKLFAAERFAPRSGARGAHDSRRPGPPGQVHLAVGAIERNCDTASRQLGMDRLTVAWEVRSARPGPAASIQRGGAAGKPGQAASRASNGQAVGSQLWAESSDWGQSLL